MSEISGLLILLANLGILGLNIKLYTEIFKNQKFDERSAKNRHDGGLGISTPPRP
jgi:hypothetical protein